MGFKMLGLLAISVLVCGTAVIGAPEKSIVGGGTETMLGQWTPGEGNIAPGAKIRNWTAPYQDIVIGPGGVPTLATGIGPVTMNCNLDDSLTGPCWGTFEFGNETGTWVGTWQGTFNFLTGAGSYHAIGHGQAGLRGMVLENDVVYPGGAFPGPQGGPIGYVYSTVKSVN